ncbi:MAG TPA: ankyrin repeat domain-containing protein [Vicinamibacterales bacterium]|nr:ankyrin repeat domain-containing protein [Vicinamibacterales bacterium]
MLALLLALTLGAGPDVVDASGSTPLLLAATKDDAPQVRQLLKAGANPNVRNRLDTTPLLEAAFHSNADIIKALLDAGADPNTAGADGQTALMLVARGTNLTAAQLLLKKGADPNASESQRGQTALMWAVANSQGAMARLLIESGANVDAKTATDLMTPLVSAEPRAQPRSPGGMTALMFASREGCLDCVKAMVEKGAAIDLPDPEGVTPLLWAIWNTRFDVAKYLIEHGANVNRFDWWGRTPLYLAVDYVTLPHGGRPDQPVLDATLAIDIVNLLLDKGADPNPQLKMTAPLRATGNDRGLDPMLSPGTTPLIRAAKAMDVSSMKALIEHGADITLANSRNITPTLAASGMGSTDADTRGYFATSDVQDRAIAALDLMFSHGGPVNGKAGQFAQVPLHGAAFWGWNRVVEYLLQKGAEINLADSRGYTAVDYAMGRAGGNSRGGQRIDVHKDTADLLMAKGGVAGTPVKQR